MFGKKTITILVIMGFVVALFAPALLAAESQESCYDIGYRYGKCATLVMLKRKCPQEDNVQIPDRCMGKKETEEGTKAGAQDVYKSLGIKGKQ